MPYMDRTETHLRDVFPEIGMDIRFEDLVRAYEQPISRKKPCICKGARLFH
jgi:hypothetical protein